MAPPPTSPPTAAEGRGPFISRRCGEKPFDEKWSDPCCACSAPWRQGAEDQTTPAGTTKALTAMHGQGFDSSGLGGG